MPKLGVDGLPVADLRRAETGGGCHGCLVVGMLDTWLRLGRVDVPSRPPLVGGHGSDFDAAAQPSSRDPCGQLDGVAGEESLQRLAGQAGQGDSLPSRTLLDLVRSGASPPSR